MSCTALWRRMPVLLILAGVFAWPGSAQDMLSWFEQNVTEFTLENGLTFIVVERHEAPVVSFFTYADVGGVDEVKGITGMAHMFEHMAFKGTTTIGTKDLEKEIDAMRRVDHAYAELKRERRKVAMAEPERTEHLEEAFERAKKEAQEYVENGEFEKVIERAGGTGLNATTGSDATRYFYSLPANKIELWFSLESDRFLNPVLREFYIERDVVMEERRMRTESSPVGRLFEEFLTTAFKAHPYGEPVVGHMSDLQSFTREEAEAFFDTYYGANNLTIAIVGSVDTEQVRRLAETYFGRLPAGAKPEPVETVEPPQIAERRVIIEEQAQPFVFIGYHKGSFLHPDDAAFSVLSDIVSRGRTSRIYKRLVDEEKIALQAAGFNNFPGSKYPNLFVFLSAPNQG
ncbi:MAG: M16 family metallopeptidase, partial [Rhodothermales bacterium]